MTHLKTKILSIFTLIIATLASSGLRAQDEMMFHTIDEQNGMSNEVVTCIEADAFGYIWIGTKTGLERYDGLSFVQMSSSKNKGNLNTAIGNSVADIKRDADGNVWIATEKGVSKFDIYTDRFSYIPRHGTVGTVNNNSYQADILFVDNGNHIYYFSQYHGLHKYDSEEKSFKPAFSTFFHNHEIRYCYKDSADCFWMLSEKENAIYKLDINGETLTDKTEAAKRVSAYFSAASKNPGKDIMVGNFCGFPLSINSQMNHIFATLHGQTAHTAELSMSTNYIVRGLQDIVNGIARKLQKQTREIAEMKVDLQQAQERADQPFPLEIELTQKSDRLATLSDALRKEAMARANNGEKPGRKTFYFDRERRDKLRNTAKQAGHRPQEKQNSKDAPAVE